MSTEAEFVKTWTNTKPALWKLLFQEVKDRKVLKELDGVKNIISDNTSDAFLLHAIPFMFPPRHMKSPADTWRSSTIESQQGFVFYIKVRFDIDYHTLVTLCYFLYFSLH